MKQFFTFAGKSSHDYGLWISGESLFRTPQRKFNEISVPGRNGTIILDEQSFENIPVVYPAFITDEMPEKIRDFANYMNSFAGYQRLEDTYAPDVYRLAQYKGGLEVKTKGYMNRMGEFEVEFNCKPQRFLKSGELVHEFTANGSIYNNTRYASKPHLRVYGGNTGGTIGIGDYLITISTISSYVDIDCELMDAYKGSENCNRYVSFNADEVFLASGMVGISFTGSITKVEIIPRTFII